MVIHISIDVFDEVCDSSRVKLLLGNGFSQAFNAEIFNYKYLLRKASLGDDEDAIRAVFKQRRTVDFEKVIKTLQQTAKTGEKFIDDEDDATDFRNRLLRAARKVEKALGKAISELHPDASTRVSGDQYTRTRGFIRNFDEIYTVNYDLLLYWVFTRDAWYKEVDCDDGFRGSGSLLWKKSTAQSQTIHYLHGALHYRQTGDGLQKTRFRSFSSIMDQVVDGLSEGEYPLLVAEGSSAAKLKKISECPYLVFCFDKFRSLKGSLVVYGFNFNPSDSHLVKAIETSGIRKLYVGLYGSPSSRRNHRIISRLTELELNCKTKAGRSSLKIFTYDAGSIEIWDQLRDE